MKSAILRDGKNIRPVVQCVSQEEKPMVTKEERSRQKLNYNRTHYKRVSLDIPFAKYDELKAHADQAGESVNGYIKKAIDQRIETEK